VPCKNNFPRLGHRHFSKLILKLMPKNSNLSKINPRLGASVAIHAGGRKNFFKITEKPAKIYQNQYLY